MIGDTFEQLNRTSFEDEVVLRLKDLDGKVATLDREIEQLTVERSNLEHQAFSFAAGLGAMDASLEGRIPDRFRSTRGRSLALGTTSSSSSYAATTPRRQARKNSNKPPQVRHDDLVRWCQEILRESGKDALHITEIVRRLKSGESRGYRVPGKGTPSNVSVHLARAQHTFVSSRGKGMWSLIDDPRD